MSGANRWAWGDVPDQRGRTAVVTGANSGIGYEAALALAQHGAAVVLACRDLERAEGAAGRIRAAVPDATVSTLHLDLAALASVRRAAERLRGAYDRLDLLIDNAGVMFPPYTKTEDGFELQFGTNHLGHFALTGLVLDRLLATPGSRVVTVSSTGHRAGAVDFDVHSSRGADTGVSPRMGSPSSPTCCSRTSCSGGWRRRTRGRSPSPPTPAYPTRS